MRLRTVEYTILGFYLGPNNTLSRNFPDGTAVYQYTSTDINYFCNEFAGLAKTLPKLPSLSLNGLPVVETGAQHKSRIVTKRIPPGNRDF